MHFFPTQQTSCFFVDDIDIVNTNPVSSKSLSFVFVKIQLPKSDLLVTDDRPFFANTTTHFRIYFLHLSLYRL